MLVMELISCIECFLCAMCSTGNKPVQLDLIKDLALTASDLHSETVVGFGDVNSLPKGVLVVGYLFPDPKGVEHLFVYGTRRCRSSTYRSALIVNADVNNFPP